jgi:hypothetical protein
MWTSYTHAAAPAPPPAPAVSCSRVGTDQLVVCSQLTSPPSMRVPGATGNRLAGGVQCSSSGLKSTPAKCSLRGNSAMYMGVKISVGKEKAMGVHRVEGMGEKTSPQLEMNQTIRLNPQHTLHQTGQPIICYSQFSTHFPRLLRKKSMLSGWLRFMRPVKVQSWGSERLRMACSRQCGAISTTTAPAGT